MADSVDIVVVGAGPYGLSIGAHLRGAGSSFRIFGTPMSTWREHMPKGMLLKSDGFASNLSDPESAFTLKHFCEQRGIPYDHTKIPVSLDTFISYGEAFQKRFVPDLEDRQVTDIALAPGGYRVTLDNGESVNARRVVLAVGITHFPFVPPTLADLPADLFSHASAHRDLERFRGRDVTVVGSGASAIDMAALLHESGVNVTIVGRKPELYFHDAPKATPRSRWQRIRHPQSGIGPGLRSRFYTDAPLMFRHLPVKLRLKIVKTHLKPAAGWPMRERVLGRFPALMGYAVQRAEAQNGRAVLTLAAADGSTRIHETDYVMAATGYKVDLRRLRFLSDELRSKIKSIENSPVLASDFQCSVPGLYFVGVAAASSFGPTLRFAFGSGFTAHHITKQLLKSAQPATSVARDLATPVGV